MVGVAVAKMMVAVVKVMVDDDFDDWIVVIEVVVEVVIEIDVKMLL